MIGKKIKPTWAALILAENKVKTKTKNKINHGKGHPSKKTARLFVSSSSSSSSSSWWIYFIQTTAQTIYTGITTNPARRLAQHRGKQKGGAKYLKAHQVAAMILLLPLPDRVLAAQMEWQLKKLSHAQKQKLAQILGQRSKQYLQQWKIDAG